MASKLNYRKLVPDDTLIAQYMDYMDETETAVAYDFFTATWLLGLACGRDIYVDRPRAPVFLNMYCILVADSGVTRKSSAVGVARKFAGDLIQDDPRITLIDSKTTPERLDEILQSNTDNAGSGRAAIIISELAVFLGTEKYTAAMPAMLTDLYDCPEHRMAGGGVSRRAKPASRVFVSLLSASTPAWLLRSVNPNVVEGGFTSRCLFVVSDAPKRKIAWPAARSSDSDVYGTQILHKLRHVRDKAKEYKTITISEGGLAAFTQWYNKRKPSLDGFSASFDSREDGHILRMAALLAVNDDSWIIHRQHITTAIRIVGTVKLDAARLFSNTEQASKWLTAIVAARDALITAGLDGITKSHLYLKVRGTIDSQEFHALLDVMHECLLIQRFERMGSVGRPAEIIRGTKLLTGKKVVEDLTNRLSL